jgi:hypothetical protein
MKFCLFIVSGDSFGLFFPPKMRIFFKFPVTLIFQKQNVPQKEKKAKYYETF